MTKTSIFISALCLLVASCSSQKVNTNYETGMMMKVKTGVVEKVSRFMVTRNSTGEGAFAEMASSAAGAITPGFMAEGSTRIASATGSLMDSKFETVAKIRVRIRLENGDRIEVLQNDIPGLSFKVGQTVIISSDGTPANVWPE